MEVETKTASTATYTKVHVEVINEATLMTIDTETGTAAEGITTKTTFTPHSVSAKPISLTIQGAKTQGTTGGHMVTTETTPEWDAPVRSRGIIPMRHHTLAPTDFPRTVSTPLCLHELASLDASGSHRYPPEEEGNIC